MEKELWVLTRKNQNKIKSYIFRSKNAAQKMMRREISAITGIPEFELLRWTFGAEYTIYPNSGDVTIGQEHWDWKITLF